MKKIFLVLICLVLLSLLIGCDNESNKKADVTTTTQAVSSYFSVMDYKTKKEITRITADSSERSLTIMDMYNFYKKAYDGEVSNPPKYTIHYVKDNNSKNDIWFNVYIFNGKLYTKRLPIKGSLLENSEDVYDMHEADTVTSEEFLKAIEIEE